MTQSAQMKVGAASGACIANTTAICSTEASRGRRSTAVLRQRLQISQVSNSRRDTGSNDDAVNPSRPTWFAQFAFEGVAPGCRSGNGSVERGTFCPGEFECDGPRLCGCNVGVISLSATCLELSGMKCLINFSRSSTVIPPPQEAGCYS